jgi:hypothetical protein
MRGLALGIAVEHPLSKETRDQKRFETGNWAAATATATATIAALRLPPEVAMPIPYPHTLSRLLQRSPTSAFTYGAARAADLEAALCAITVAVAADPLPE